MKALTFSAARICMTWGHNSISPAIWGTIHKRTPSFGSGLSFNARAASSTQAHVLPSGNLWPASHQVDFATFIPRSHNSPGLCTASCSFGREEWEQPAYESLIVKHLNRWHRGGHREDSILGAASSAQPPRRQQSLRDWSFPQSRTKIKCP